MVYIMLCIPTIQQRRLIEYLRAETEPKLVDSSVMNHQIAVMMIDYRSAGSFRPPQRTRDEKGHAETMMEPGLNFFAKRDENVETLKRQLILKQLISVAPGRKFETLIRCQMEGVEGQILHYLEKTQMMHEIINLL